MHGQQNKKSHKPFTISNRISNHVTLRHNIYQHYKFFLPYRLSGMIISCTFNRNMELERYGWEGFILRSKKHLASILYVVVEQTQHVGTCLPWQRQTGLRKEYGVVTNIELLRPSRNTSKEKHAYIYGSLNEHVRIPHGTGGLLK
jgi:hypothetical protein